MAPGCLTAALLGIAGCGGQTSVGKGPPGGAPSGAPPVSLTPSLPERAPEAPPPKEVVSPKGSPTAAGKETGAAPPSSRSAPLEDAPSPPPVEERALARAVPLQLPKEGKQEGAANGGIILNFDDADLYEVIKTLADLLGINYVVDPNVRGKVTIHTAGGLSRGELFGVFFQILEVNGLTALREGSLYKIVPVKDAQRLPLSSRVGLRRGAAGGREMIIQIIPLRHASAQEMTKVLTPFVSAGGSLVAEPGSNTLLVVDTPLNLMKVLRLVAVFDVDLFERMNHRFYPLKYADAEEAQKILQDIFANYLGSRKEDVKFIGIDRINTLLVISKDPGVFGRVEDLVRQLDVTDTEAEPRIYVYFVRNGEAENLADLLKEIFEKKGKEKKKKIAKEKAKIETSYRNPLSAARKEAEREAKEAQKKAEAATPATAPKPALETAEGAGTLRAEVSITADSVRNALIIEATPSDYRIIEGILKELDRMPRQVLIEATIAEITRDAAMDLGMEWAFGKGAAAGSGAFSATLGTGGLQYSIGVTDKWYAALNALASKGKVNVLSSPHVLAADNREAKIDVSREIPVASSEWTYTSGTEPITQTNVEYRDTGVMLTVTPHINDRGLVTMDISQEVSELSENVKVAGKEYPSFFKRTITTTLAVADGQTLAIGGLIKDKESEGISGVPCLINVPALRYLFGTWGWDTEKTELIVLITPRVIVDLEDVTAVTEEFKKKVQNVVRRFRR